MAYLDDIDTIATDLLARTASPDLTSDPAPPTRPRRSAIATENRRLAEVMAGARRLATHARHADGSYKKSVVKK